MAKRKTKRGRVTSGAYVEPLVRGRDMNLGADVPESVGADVWCPTVAGAGVLESEEIAFGPQHVFRSRRQAPGVRRGMGWLRDLPDVRDTTRLRQASRAGAPKDADQHRRAFDRVAKALSTAKALPSTVDHAEFCSPIEDQGNLGSCTANSCAGMVEYMERRATGQHIDASRLFLYKVTRMLDGWEGDTGAYLRTTMKALVLFGMPPEQAWPYKIRTYDREPSAFLYAYAANYKAVQYLRLDRPDLSPSETLNEIRTALSKGFAAMFGFSVYSSLGDDPDIPYPLETDKLDGGHAVLAVGYDDKRECIGTDRRGALKIRNSWGAGWGENGYGWLPYAYVLSGLADDFWTAFQLKWVDTGKFD